LQGVRRTQAMEGANSRGQIGDREIGRIHSRFGKLDSSP
jgi:hypothetical protein